MCEVRKVKSSEIFPIIREVLQGGRRAWITVTGMSMYPFLREHKDSVELSEACLESVGRGDIVLIRRLNGEYILHRIIKKDGDLFYIMGDAQRWLEGPLKREQLMAVVTAVSRKDHRFSCRNRLWRCLSAVWVNIVPYRKIILRGMGFLLQSGEGHENYRRV